MDKRMTYRELLKDMTCWSEWELDCDITILDIVEDECYLGVIERGRDTHDSLDDYHPVFSFNR